MTTLQVSHAVRPGGRLPVWRPLVASFRIGARQVFAYRAEALVMLFSASLMAALNGLLWTAATEGRDEIAAGCVGRCVQIADRLAALGGEFVDQRTHALEPLEPAPTLGTSGAQFGGSRLRRIELAGDQSLDQRLVFTVVLDLHASSMAGRRSSQRRMRSRPV